MRMATKVWALLLAMLMVISALPMSVFAESSQPSEAKFDLIVDGNGKDDDEVSSETAGMIPSGTDLYEDGVLKGMLTLDWDQYFTKEQLEAQGRDIGYVLWRNQGELVSSGDVSGEYEDKNWEQISIFDGHKIRVLVVYPQLYAGTENGKNVYSDAVKTVMRSWLEETPGTDGPAGKGLFTIVEVPLYDHNVTDAAASASATPVDFNRSYEKVLKTYDYSSQGIVKAEGEEYNFDVILFGTADANGGANSNGTFDLSKNAAGALEDYLAAGGGVLFGHDTICSAGVANHPNFNSFTDELGIALLKTNANSSSSSSFDELTTKVAVVEDGTLTSYPWKITGTLTVPETHNMFQVTGSAVSINGSAVTPGKVWMELLDGDDANDYYGSEVENNHIQSGYSVTNPKANAYLITNDNVAMIQTGHSTTRGGITTEDERKVFANTLFYLMDKKIASYAKDIDFADEDAPVVNGPAVTSTDVNAVAEDIKANMTVSGPGAKDGKQVFGASFSWSGVDVGTPYKYYVQATVDAKEASRSNEIQAIAISDLKGYKVVLKDSEGNVLDEQEITAADGESVSCSTPDNLETGKTYELHITPVDCAGNKGKTVPVKFDVPATPPTVDTEITPAVSDSDIPEDSRVEKDVPVVDEDGDPVVDEEGNPVTEDITYYYPGNYLDKEGNEFDERQVDEKIVLDVETTVDYGNREIIGVVTVKDKDGNIIEVPGVTDTPIEANPSYDKPSSEQITIPIKDIYGDCTCPADDCDYLEDGNFTITITWKDANTDEEVAEDSSKIVVKRPDYKVTFNYLDESKGEAVEKSTVVYVKHGDDAKAPKVKKTVTDKDDEIKYIFKNWDNEYTDIIEDTVVNAVYSNHSTGTAPETPEEPEKPEAPKEDPELIRLGGETRIETAIEISKEGWDKSKVVILATANEFPDAMAGVPLAKAVDAPILLTVNGEKLEEIVKEEIARLSPEKVYILGQTEAVNANIEAELDELYLIERLGGKDRFGTAVEIAEEMEEVYDKKADAVYFVRSDLFPDALSVSSVAAIEHRPILYVAPNGRVDEPTTEYCKTIGTSATIIGGPEAVVEAGEFNIKALFQSVDRIYGRDRYATSVEVCSAKSSLFTGSGTALATGKKFPDALTGGSFAAKNNIPVLLVNGSVSTDLSVYLANRPIKTLYVFGGELAVSDEVAYDALSYCRYLYY